MVAASTASRVSRVCFSLEFLLTKQQRAATRMEITARKRTAAPATVGAMMRTREGPPLPGTAVDDTTSEVVNLSEVVTSSSLARYTVKKVTPTRSGNS